ncbi:hypothetical protein [Cryobacterium zongtaii]|uniref:hypothetical protein n=1 Tax=Cryobacterium zongtaii TaxID=1259217 RepID=UPI0013FD89AA|nr:hypothetical protein [Cryobacterium zongtaii]
MVATMSMSGLSLSLGSLKLLPEHVLIVVLAVTCALTPGLVAGIGAIRKRQFIAIVSVLSWLAVSVAASVANSPDPGQSLKLLAWTAVNLLGLFVAYLHPLPLLTKVRDFVAVTCVLCGFYFLAWAYASATGVSSILVSKDYASNSFRAQGLMLEPNILAGLCVLVAGLAFVYRRHLSNTFLSITLVVLGLTVGATITRVAWVMFAGLLVAFLFKWASFGKRVFLSAVLVGICAIAFQGGFGAGLGGELTETLSARLGSLFQFDGGTGRFRLQSASTAINEIFRAGFPGGLGFNSFPQRHESSLTSTGDLYLGLLWLVIFYDSGFIGGALFLVSFILVWTSSPRSASLFFVTFAAVASTTNPIWYAFPWVLVALIFSARSLTTPPPASLEMTAK